MNQFLAFSKCYWTDLRYTITDYYREILVMTDVMTNIIFAVILWRLSMRRPSTTTGTALVHFCIMKEKIHSNSLSKLSKMQFRSLFRYFIR